MDWQVPTLKTCGSGILLTVTLTLLGRVLWVGEGDFARGPAPARHLTAFGSQINANIWVDSYDYYHDPNNGLNTSERFALLQSPPQATKPLGIIAPSVGLTLLRKLLAISIIGTHWTCSWVLIHSINRSCPREIANCISPWKSLTSISRTCGLPLTSGWIVIGKMKSSSSLQIATLRELSSKLEKKNLPV
jgi:hypothetical protein